MILLPARLPWATVAALAVLLAAIASAWLGWPGLKPRAAGPPDRIAFVGVDGDLYTIAPDGRHQQQLSNGGGPEGTPDRSVHLWPTWSPDGRRIAAIRADLRDGQPIGTSLKVVSSSGGESRRLYGSHAVEPFFAGWAPNGRTIAFLSQEGGAISLRVVSPEGVGPIAPLASGGPVYFAWSPDSASLVVHVGGSRRVSSDAHVSLLERRSPPGALPWSPLVSLPAPGQPSAGRSEPTASADSWFARTLPMRPSNFRVPAFTRDGRALVVAEATEPVGEEVVVWSFDAPPPRTLLTLDDDAAFALSPRGDRVAVTRQAGLSANLRRGVALIDLASGAVTPLYSGAVVGFFWAPDGSRLAWVGMDLAERELLWFVGDGVGPPQQVAGFEPTPQLGSTLGYFEQHAHTAALWSSDSRSLLFTGWLGHDREGPSKVWVVEAVAGAQPRAIAEGIAASWSPPRQPPSRSVRVGDRPTS
jgi:hypothetical protein